MQTRGTNRTDGGFTLPELMVAIFLSILVITALYTVFSRVQDMFRVGHNQALVLERGRAIMDMIVRDVEMMQAAKLPGTENFISRNYGVEFYEPGNRYLEGNKVFLQKEGKYYECLKAQPLPGGVYSDPPGIHWRRINSGAIVGAIMPGGHPAENEILTYLPPDLMYYDRLKIAGRLLRYPNGNNNGKIEKLEVPKEFWPMFDRFALDKNGIIAGSETNRLLPSEGFYSGDFSFLGYDRAWHLFGYGLYSPKGARITNPLVGSLYRYNQRWKMDHGDIPSEMGLHKSRLGRTYYDKIADGIVHLRVRYILPKNLAFQEEGSESGYSLPGYVEVEMGLLEDTVVRELETRAEEFIVDPADRLGSYHDFRNSQLAFIEGNLDRLHMFRQLVPIRNARHFRYAAESNNMAMRAFRQMGMDISHGPNHIFLMDRSASMALEHRMEDVNAALRSTLDQFVKPSPSMTAKTYRIIFFGSSLSVLPGLGDHRRVPGDKLWVDAECLTTGGTSDPAPALARAFSLSTPNTTKRGTTGTKNGTTRCITT